jgi:hypothetical protein
VAKALDQIEIEAQVTIWRVAGALPWAQAAPARGAARRALSI